MNQKVEWIKMSIYITFSCLDWSVFPSQRRTVGEHLPISDLWYLCSRRTVVGTALNRNPEAALAFSVHIYEASWELKMTSEGLFPGMRTVEHKKRGNLR